MKEPAFLYHNAARMISFLAAITISLLILIYPAFVTGDNNQVNHGMLTLMMCGMAAGFVHGTGFKPVSLLWRILFGPYCGWPLMFGGLFYFLIA